MTVVTDGEVDVDTLLESVALRQREKDKVCMRQIRNCCYELDRLHAVEKINHTLHMNENRC